MRSESPFNVPPAPWQRTQRASKSGCTSRLKRTVSGTGFSPQPESAPAAPISSATRTKPETRPDVRVRMSVFKRSSQVVVELQHEERARATVRAPRPGDLVAPEE